MTHCTATETKYHVFLEKFLEDFVFFWISRRLPLLILQKTFRKEFKGKFVVQEQKIDFDSFLELGLWWENQLFVVDINKFDFKLFPEVASTPKSLIVWLHFLTPSENFEICFSIHVNSQRQN